MRRGLVVAAALFCGCVPQVRGTRLQKPFQEAQQGTRIALVRIEVPAWVSVPQGADPKGQLRAGVLAAFKKGPYQVEDQLGAGFQIAIDPDSKPIIQPTAGGIGVVGKPYLISDDGAAHALGAPPITWKATKAPAGFTIDPQSGRVTWTPSQVGDYPIELVAAGAKGETSYPFMVAVVEPARAGQIVPMKPGNVVAPDQTFIASLPPSAPSSVDAPLLLGLEVIEWSQGSEPMGNMSRAKVTTDVVYSLMTREGRQIETRRVRLEGVPVVMFDRRLTLVPERPYWQRWDDAEDLEPSHPGIDEKELFPTTAMGSALAFAFPYTEHKVMFSVELDGSSPALKPGIELSNKGDYEGAYNSFAEAAKADPKLAGAYYDMGVMREVQGQDKEALELVKRAAELNPGEGMYQRHLPNLQQRVEQRKPIELK